MRHTLAPHERTAISIAYITAGGVILVRYLLFTERWPNYVRIITWFESWWHWLFA